MAHAARGIRAARALRRTRGMSDRVLLLPPGSTTTAGRLAEAAALDVLPERAAVESFAAEPPARAAPGLPGDVVLRAAAPRGDLARRDVPFARV